MANEFVIDTKDLTKQYGVLFWKKKVPALDKLTIQIPRGSVFGFLGPNGAGKTTTIKMLMDLIQPTSGSATVLGAPVWDINMKKRIGFLPDTPAFNGLMKASEFLHVCAKLFHLPRKVRYERVAEVLEIVHMTDHAKEKLAGFSRGMLQRIGVAQALLNKPELLILDEPLLGLDPYGRQDLKNIILDQNKSGTTIFFSSHILADVQEICDRVAILNKGHLLCTGKINDLLHTENLVIRIKDGNDLVAGLMNDAKECLKKDGNTWELTFDCSQPGVTDKLKKFGEEHKEKAELVEQAESLEDFFFRTIETNNKKRMEEEGGSAQ
ncbi:MAG: ABC transporter ATP-binding protein [Lentisphaeria bacterium]|nr:ABC transporter ATP-binding protein [Lentisphaeria bacterium]